jgi:hypothetical protein
MDTDLENKNSIVYRTTEFTPNNLRRVCVVLSFI